MNLVIDADTLVYNASFAAERNYYAVVRRLTPPGAPHNELVACDVDYEDAKKVTDAGGDFAMYKRSEVLSFDVAQQALKAQLRTIKREVEERFGKVKPRLLLTGYSNFRDRIAELARYKFNRVERAKPRHYGLCRKYLIDEMGAELVHWFEADDEAAISLTEGKANCVVSSIDKDLLQVPGKHHIQGKGFIQISEKSGLIRFYMQALGGDSTDGIPGCYKIGAVTAKKVLLTAAEAATSFKDLERRLWGAVVAEYSKSLAKHGAAKCGYEDAQAAALETARLVYLLRERPKNPNWIDLWEAPT